MKKLFKLAFENKKNRWMLFFTLIAMCLFTVASQLEILAIGVITKEGPKFFEVLPQEQIKKSDFDESFLVIDKDQKGFITKSDVNAYLDSRKNRGIVERLISKVNDYIPISGNVLGLALMLVLVALFKSITLFLHRFTTKLIAIRVSQSLRQKYFEHIQTLPLIFFQKYNSGTLSSRAVGDASQIAQSINACLVNYVQTPFTVLTTLVICFLTSWQLSLIIFLGFPLIVIPIIFLTKGVKRVSKQLQQNQEKFASVLIDFLAGIQTVKVFAMEDFSLKKYRQQNEKMASLEKKSARYDLSTSPIVHLIGMCFLATALLYGLHILQMTITEVFFYCGMLYFFYMPIKKFAEENGHIQRGVVAAERMFEVLELRPEIEDVEGAKKLSGFNSHIEFDNVWFRYEDKWILKGFNLSIKKGETVAIVGPTGSGKSTLVQLLPRLYQIEKGEIRIDGQCIKTFTQKSLREAIAFIPQKPFLFLDSISGNISYGRNYSEMQVEHAARSAHAEEFILDLPKGYETELAETGKNLSGGQQQRLAIARALVKQAPILIMDEATSSLDNVSENHIKRAIFELKGKVTQLIIAHRLSTIEGADKIIYIDKGEKVAEGTREELLESCEGFQKMWETMHHESLL